jgi:hypothetical protein
MWYYEMIGLVGLHQIERERRCRFPHLEKHLADLAPRPLLMIHGKADTYIKPEMAGRLFELADPPKEFWLVENAKHNQALQVAGAEYQQRVLQFFEKNLAETTAEASPTAKHTNPAKKKTQKESANKMLSSLKFLLVASFYVLEFFSQDACVSRLAPSPARSP